jgi:type IV secretion system protein VirB11
MNAIAQLARPTATSDAWQDRFPSLAVALSRLGDLLDDPLLTEISVNAPGVVFVERLGDPQMTAISAPQCDAAWIRWLSERVAGATNQHINEETPILSASLPSGERFQAILPPAAPEGGAISIRKQVTRDLSLADYVKSGALGRAKVSGTGERSEAERRLARLLCVGDIEGFLTTALRERVSMIVSGGTSTGKTTFLNALLKDVPRSERIVTIEDTLELVPPHKNCVRLLASKGGQSAAKVDAQSLLEASLRMRPDRLLLGELRGAETFTFLQAINTGHPGSLTTVHANSPRTAYERLALMGMQSGMSLAKADVLAYLKEVIPVVVQLGRENGDRVVSEILYVGSEG